MGHALRVGGRIVLSCGPNVAKVAVTGAGSVIVEAT